LPCYIKPFIRSSWGSFRTPFGSLYAQYCLRKSDHLSSRYLPTIGFLPASTCSMVCADGLDPTKMSTKPIFVATHPRACSTAFERVSEHGRRSLPSVLTLAQVFLTRKETLNCIHEPFGDAFYYGPERLSSRFEDDEGWRIKSGFNNSTYRTIFEHIDKQSSEVRLLSPVVAATIVFSLMPDIHCFRVSFLSCM
jgi:hypothetical protein